MIAVFAKILDNINMSPETIAPLSKTAGTRLNRVSSVGQLSLPSLVAKRWGLEAGGPVHILDLEDLLNGTIMVTPEYGRPLPETVRNLGKYTISSANQFSLPADIRRQWSNPRRVEFNDLKDCVLYHRLGTTVDIVRKMLPDDDFLLPLTHEH